MKDILKYILGVFICMFVAVSFVSCSDDDDKAKNPMVGTWQEYINTR